MPEVSYVVMLKPKATLDPQAAGEFLAEAKGIPKFIAIKELRDRAGIISTNLDADRAATLTKKLTAAGMDAIGLPSDQLVAIPEALELREARFDRETLEVKATDAPPKSPFREIPWLAIRFMAGARVRSNEIVERRTAGIDTQSTSYRRGITVRYDMSTKQVAQSSWTCILDFFVARPWGHYRIVADRFQYRTSGLPLKPSSYDNFSAICDKVADRARRAVLDKSIALIIDGAPGERLQWNSVPQYVDYLHWQLQFLPDIDR